jgi:hypothetical protein
LLNFSGSAAFYLYSLLHFYFAFLSSRGMELSPRDEEECRCHTLDNMGAISPQQRCVLCGIDDATAEITLLSRHSRCLQCHSLSNCVIIYHSSCLNILKKWSTIPEVTITDVENLGICTRMFFEPPIRMWSAESISRGLLSPSTKEFLEARFSQSLIRRLPMDIVYLDLLSNLKLRPFSNFAR